MRKFAGMGVAEGRKLKQLKDENRKLKQLVADLSLDEVVPDGSRRARHRLSKAILSMPRKLMASFSKRVLIRRFSFW